MKRKPYHKSATFWITTWAVGIITYIVFKGLNYPWIPTLVGTLGGYIMIYCGGNKAIDFKHGPQVEKEQGE